MGRVGRMSPATGTLACLAAGLSGLGSSALPLAGASVAAAADESAYRYRSPTECHPRLNAISLDS